MGEPSLKDRTISGMLWAGMQKFGTQGITFLSNIVLARLLSPTDYGMVGMLAIFIAVSNSFIDGGFGSALIQKSRPTQRDYSTVFYWNIILSIFLYIVLFVAAPFIESFYENITGLAEILRVQGVVLIINAITIVQFNQLRKAMKFKLLAKINVSSAVISVVGAIILAFYGAGVWSLVWQQIILSFSNCVFLWIYCKWKPEKTFSFESLKELFGFGSFIMLSSLVNTIGTNIYGLLIGHFFTPVKLGYFTQAKKIEDVSSVGLLSVIEQVTYPMLVEVKDNNAKIANVLEKFNSALMALTMPLLYCLAIMAEPIIIFLFSDKWLPSAPILQILSIYGIFICLQGCNYNVIAAIGKSKVIFKWTIYKRISSIIVLIASLYAFGFNGLMAGIVATGIIIAGSNMYLVAKYIGYSLKNQIKGLIPVITLSTIPFIIFFSLSQFTSIGTPIYSKCIIGILYLIIYLLTLWYVPFQSIRILRNMVNDIIQNYRKRTI